MRLTKDLIVKAIKAFKSNNGILYTNEVLTRRELRFLENRSLVRSKYSSGIDRRLIWSAEERLLWLEKRASKRLKEAV